LKPTKIISFLHAFFIVKKEEHYRNNIQVINDFIKSPGLYRISANRNIDIQDVYNIVKTHDINVLNTNIIKLIENTK